ncbi:MAG: OmpA family protein [Desulfobacterales bacterium]|nr:OmpA family protein [Desulfobacterales bacterium]
MKLIKRVKIMFFLLAMLSIAFINGCVSKGVFQKTNQDQNDKLQVIQKIAEANERKIGNLRAESKYEFARLDGRVDDAMAKGNEALKKAEMAEELAKKLSNGKVIFEVAYTSDAGKFGFNKYELSDEFKAILDDIAKMIKTANRQLFIEIQGHTDDRGSEEYNMNLGLKRAEAVRQYFSEINMLPLHMMHAISYGESRPLANNSTKEGRAQNRRVVIIVLE